MDIYEALKRKLADINGQFDHDAHRIYDLACEYSMGEETIDFIDRHPGCSLSDIYYFLEEGD